MKLITHIYVTIICSILSLVALAFLATAFPFAIIIELITFISECFSEDEFEHGIWLKQCKDWFIYIKNIYYLIINSPYED